MSDHPGDEERMDASHAAMTRERRQGQRSNIFEMSFVAGAAVLIAISTMFGAWNTYELRKLQQATVAERELILKGTECLVEQMAEHRHLNALAHRANASDHEYSYPIPAEEEPPPVPGKLKESCAQFIATTTSSTTTR